MILTNSERAPIFTVIGFIFFLVGALAIPKEFYIVRNRSCCVLCFGIIFCNEGRNSDDKYRIKNKKREVMVLDSEPFCLNYKCSSN